MNTRTIESEIEDMVDCVDYVLLSEDYSKGIQYSITIDRGYVNISKDVESGEYGTIFKIFGFDKEFKQLFKSLNKVTDIPKERIVHILRNEKVARVYDERVVLEFIF